MLDKPAIKFLNDLGYNPVSYPYREFEPMDVLYRAKKKLARLGSVSYIIADTSEKKPKIERDRETPKISGHLTAKFNFSLGVSALDNLLSAIGVPGVGVKGLFKNAKSFTFEYKNVLLDSSEPLAIAKYLGNSVPDMKNKLIGHFDEKKEAYIVLEVLKSNSFSITSKDKNECNLDIDVANLQDIISVQPGITVKKTEDYTVSFKGKKYFNFAIMVMMMWVSPESQSFEMMIPGKPPGVGTKAMFSMEEKDAQNIFSPPLIQPGELLDISD
ncbi:MAG: hypothetical protein JW885_09190 [Deltaproteobacteria bacterium]|nr:hypothetical protein [Candidatus Zymogenaceae bacterium]